MDAAEVHGSGAEYVRIGDAGTRAAFRFCPVCGTSVFHTDDQSKDSIAIAVGAFADPGFPAPTVSVYEERMHGWVSLPTNLKHLP